MGRGQAPNACYSRGHGRENSRGGGRSRGTKSKVARLRRWKVAQLRELPLGADGAPRKPLVVLAAGARRRLALQRAVSRRAPQHATRTAPMSTRTLARPGAGAGGRAGGRAGLLAHRTAGEGGGRVQLVREEGRDVSS